MHLAIHRGIVGFWQGRKLYRSASWPTSERGKCAVYLETQPISKWTKKQLCSVGYLRAHETVPERLVRSFTTPIPIGELGRYRRARTVLNLWLGWCSIRERTVCLEWKIGKKRVACRHELNVKGLMLTWTPFWCDRVSVAFSLLGYLSAHSPPFASAAGDSNGETF